MLRMADVELTSVDWLWFPYIPFGKLTIIQGNPVEGKTYFAMRLAAACTNRKPLPGMETLDPFNIIYQTAEDGLGDTVKPRLMEADADLDRVLVLDDRDTPLTLADERIARACLLYTSLIHRTAIILSRTSLSARPSPSDTTADLSLIHISSWFFRYFFGVNFFARLLESR